jgi:hypothetical protein
VSRPAKEPPVLTPNREGATSRVNWILSGSVSFYSRRNGAPKNSPFDHWITPDRKLIIVAIYYRLSVLGYLAHPKFVSSGLADLNVGIQDQVEALTWIHSNIAKFGGDPSKISLQ